MTPPERLPEIALPPGSRLIADLHLDPENERPWRAFQDWLAALSAPVLVVLGDLFEYWLGPAQAEAREFRPLIAALAARGRAGTELHFLHGNRDFLLGAEFEAAVGGRVHPRGLVGRLGDGGRVLCVHGDEFATLDRSYQRMRRVLRSTPARGLARALPLPVSRGIARGLRRRSRQAVSQKTPAYVELQAAEARAWAARLGARHVLCGHAHRFRSEDLAGGGRWVVLDAFGGSRDQACATAQDLQYSSSSGGTG